MRPFPKVAVAPNALVAWVLALACTPSAREPVTSEHDEPPEVPIVLAPEPDDEDAACGALALEGGKWRNDHPLLPSLQAGWHPSPESGRPIAMRDAVAPWLPVGHRFVRVLLEGVPRDVESCWVASDAAGESAGAMPGHRRCEGLTSLLHDAPVATWPRTAGDWARLFGTSDGAAAVFTTPEELAQCSDSDALPPIHGWITGLRGTPEVPVLTFVERIDNARMRTWLRVELRHSNGHVDIDRTEIATIMRPQPRTAVAEPELPAWDAVWPHDADPVRAILRMRVPRRHPLWSTPITEPCPDVVFSALTPDFTGGDTDARVRERIARIGKPRLGRSPSEVMLVHDHLALPGVRLVAAMNSDSSCMMGWSHTHCLVADAETEPETQPAAWCPDGTAADLQAIVDRFELVPASLSDAQWMELVAIASGVPKIVLEPTLLSECTAVPGARARAPRVERGWNRVAVELTAIEDDGEGREYRVEIDAGRVHMTSQPVWAAPNPDDLWGAVR